MKSYFSQIQGKTAIETNWYTNGLSFVIFQMIILNLFYFINEQ